ncbi:hypothetical protein AURDEDRAFT_165305 [Auricularia subglabra TFB-10046 SS5]|nr:hypothetical protein AURDEDRAFT_165305 [Auricularia subglabra TFB-10046 SS5]
MQDNTILVLTHTISVSTLSPIPEQDERLRTAAASPRPKCVPEEIEDRDIVADEMLYKTQVVDPFATLSSRKATDCDVEQPPAQVAPHRKKTPLVRIILLGIALEVTKLRLTLVPIWSSWSTFVYFLVLATLWPYPRTPLTDSDAATTLALVCGMALPIVTVLLFLWALSPSGIVAAFKTRRKDRGNCATLWPYVLLFVGATLATLVPVAASYAVLSRGGECSGSAHITAYLSAGRTGDGAAVLFDGSGRFDSYTLSRAGEGTIAFSNGTTTTTYYERNMVGARSVVVDDGGQVAIRIVGRAPVGIGCRIVKVCTAHPRERGEQSMDLIAQALWAHIEYSTEKC